MARNSYKRKFRDDYSYYDDIKARRYTREGKRVYNLERSTYLRDEDDGYHFHIDLNLNKELIGKVGKVAKKLFGGILDYVDSGEYDDRYDDDRDRRSRRAIEDRSYPERNRRR